VRVVLKVDWLGRNKGEQISVSDIRAKALIKAGIARKLKESEK
jgi:hypothetical protein